MSNCLFLQHAKWAREILVFYDYISPSQVGLSLYLIKYLENLNTFDERSIPQFHAV